MELPLYFHHCHQSRFRSVLGLLSISQDVVKYQFVPRIPVWATRYSLVRLVFRLITTRKDCQRRRYKQQPGTTIEGAFRNTEILFMIQIVSHPRTFQEKYFFYFRQLQFWKGVIVLHCAQFYFINTTAHISYEDVAKPAKKF